MRTVRAIVSGRVQGVWFRAHTRDKAVELGVRGFVRNLPDGKVEIVAQASVALVEALLGWARIGPPLSQVSEVRTEDLAGDEEYSTFEVRY